MAISFVSAISNSSGSRTTTRTESFTVSGGTDRIFIAQIQVENGFSVTGVTFNGVAMTQQGAVAQSIGTFNNTYQYYLVNPPTGTYNLGVTTSGSAFVYLVAGEYNGVDQSTPFDGSMVANKITSGTTVTTNITTTIDDCWLIGMGQAQSNTLSAGTGTVKRTTPITTYETWQIMVDSNGGKTPAGTYSLQVSRSSSGAAGLVVSALRPAGAAPAYRFVPQLRPFAGI